VPRVVAVLGMHRSGTSATVGTIEQHGISLGPVSRSNRFNPRGNRELRPLVKLHDRILDRNGGAWWRPPATVALLPGDRQERDGVLATIPGDTVAVKDPRILPLLELWRDLEPLRIGVIRNPVAVRRSLERRAREDGRELLDAEGWEALWRRYNAILLAELEREPFPLVDFDRTAELDAQVRSALAFHGLEAGGEGTFFDPGLVHERDDGWRDEALSPESVALWDRLSAFV